MHHLNRVEGPPPWHTVASPYEEFLALTTTEFGLLHILIENRGAVVVHPYMGRPL